MFEVLMREHIMTSIELFDLPTGQEYVKKSKKRYYGNKEKEEDGLLASKICDNIRGHTSFLTFANLYPSE
jgi:hypothetical protein